MQILYLLIYVPQKTTYYNKMTERSILRIRMSTLTCETTIMLYKSSLGACVGTARLTSATLQLLFLCLGLGWGGGGTEGMFWSSARWSSRRRPCEVASKSKNSSFCSEVMEEKTTVWNDTSQVVQRKNSFTSFTF